MPDQLAETIVRPIRGWGHWTSMGQAFQDYRPGTDVAFDRYRAGVPGLLLRYIVGPIYLWTGEGWAIADSRGHPAAILYLRRRARRGVRVLHIDNIEVAEPFRHQGMAQRLLVFAEQVARRERRPFLTLAATATNTPALTLYRRLGYVEQHHQRYSAPATSLLTCPAASQESPGIRLRALPPRPAARNRQRMYRIELEQSLPSLVEVLSAYCPPRPPSGAQRILTGARMYAVELDGARIGHCDIYRQSGMSCLRLILVPALWGSGSERQVLAEALRQLPRHGERISIQVGTAAHHRALRDAPEPIAAAFGLTEESSARLAMIKEVPYN